MNGSKDSDALMLARHIIYLLERKKEDCADADKFILDLAYKVRQQEEMKAWKL